MLRPIIASVRYFILFYCLKKMKTPPLERPRRARGSLLRRIAFRPRSPDRLRPFDERLLAEVGDLPVHKITVMRQPLGNFYRTFLNKLLERKLADLLHDPYERLFHLSLWINDAYVLEKTQVVRFHAMQPPLDPNVETLDVPLPQSSDTSLTIRALIERTMETVGVTQFARYEAFGRNCQHFVRDVLDANQLNTSEATAFVVQDAAAILAALPQWVRKCLRLATGAAARLDHVTYGNAVAVDLYPQPVNRYQLMMSQIEQYRRSAR
jgi:hypothetical protein